MAKSQNDIVRRLKRAFRWNRLVFGRKQEPTVRRYFFI